MTKMMIAATVAGGLSLMSAEAFACGEPAQNKDMIVDMTMIAHENILPIEQKTVFANGTTAFMTKDDTWSEKTAMVRCPMPTSYEFLIETDLLEDALSAGEPVHISLDTNYETENNDKRGCVNIPIIDAKIEEDVDGLSSVFFTLNETLDQSRARKSFIDIVDKNNRNNEAWCYTIQLP